MPYVWIAVALFIAISSGTAGFKIARNACEAGKAESMRAAETARLLDENFIKGVDYRNQETLAALRAFKAAKHTEIIRETQKIEYRCPLLPDGERLRLDSIRAANRAASGEPDVPVPADTGKPSEGSRRTPDSLFGTDGDVR
jgi:hypothetical protein